MQILKATSILNSAASFEPGRESNRADLFTAFSKQFEFDSKKNKRPMVLENLSQQSVLCQCKHFSWCHGGISSVNPGTAQPELPFLRRVAGLVVKFPSAGVSDSARIAEHARASRCKAGSEEAAGRAWGGFCRAAGGERPQRLPTALLCPELTCGAGAASPRCCCLCPSPGLQFLNHKQFVENSLKSSLAGGRVCMLCG